MVPHHTNIKRIATVTVVLTVAIEIMFVLAMDIDPKFIPYRSGLIITLVGLFWLYFDKIGWRQSFFRVGGWLCNTPNLNGRWEGKVDRASENTPHGFVVEIRQTFSKLKMHTYSANSKGNSIACRFVTDETEEKYILVVAWKCRTRCFDDQDNYEEFYGTSIIEYSVQGKTRKLEDHYFTDRNPQTRGNIDVAWVGNKLHDRFD